MASFSELIGKMAEASDVLTPMEKQQLRDETRAIDEAKNLVKRWTKTGTAQAVFSSDNRLSYFYMENSSIPTGTIGQSTTFTEVINGSFYLTSTTTFSYPKQNTRALLFGYVVVETGAVNLKLTAVVDGGIPLGTASIILSQPCLSSGATYFPFISFINPTNNYTEISINMVHGAAGSKNAEGYVGIMYIEDGQ